MASLTLQPNETLGKDTYLSEVLPTRNHGVATVFVVGRTSDASSDHNALIRFDVSSIPNVLVTSAILTLWCSAEEAANDLALTVHKSLVEFFEGAQSNGVPAGGEDASTWNLRNANGSVAWGTVGGLAGTDYVTTATDTETITGTGAAFTWDVTADVQDFVDGTSTNNGWWIVTASAIAARKHFVSSGGATASERPKLVVTYEPVEMSGSAAGAATASGTLAIQLMSASAAGAATASGAIVADGFLHGATAGAATVSGAVAVQEMSGSAAGLATVTGGGRAVLLPRVPIWTAIVAGVEYALSGGNPFHRLQATGLGISNIRNIKQRGPFQDGATRRDFRLDERFLNLVFLLQGATCAQADTYRDRLIEIFKPLTDTPCQIRVTRDDGVIKQIDTYAVGVLDLPETENERFAATQRVMVQLEAPNPIWYGPALQNLGFTSVLGGTEGFLVPITIPWAQQPGEYINATESFYYEGNWKEYPVIVITGPAIDAKITNLITNEKIDFTGYTIAAGDTRTIDLRFGTKTVKDAAGVLKNSELTSDSNLGTFHLEPSPGATGGINDIKVEILGGGTTATSVSIQYYNRYIHL